MAMGEALKTTNRMLELIKHLIYEKTGHFITGVLIGFGSVINFVFGHTFLAMGFWEFMIRIFSSFVILGVSGLTTALFSDVYKKIIGPWVWKKIHPRIKRFINKKYKHGKDENENGKAA